MTVLYIDTFSQFGHTNLNKVFIQQFRNKGYKVSVIARTNYLEDIEVPIEDILLRIPETYYNSSAGRIRDRLLQFRILQFIKKRVSLRKYDIVFFSYFDEIVFPLSVIKGNLIFMNHSNVTGLENTLKRFFLKCIAKMGTILVFHETIRDQFLKFGITNVIVEPLGLTLPYDNDSANNRNLLNKIDTRIVSLDYRLKIFIPTVSKYQDDFLYKVLSNDSFLNFLILNKVLLVLKDKSIEINHPNICLLKSFLSEEIYQAVFISADFLMLHYPASFKYKVSASLFECFSNNKPCFLSDIDAFRVFQSHFNYDPYYNSIEKFTELIQVSLDRKDLIVKYPYNNTSLLNPSLETISSSMNQLTI